MHKSIGHCLLIAVVAIVFSSVGSGCKSGGWSMPGASWASWGKKKPPTSSIAGTREPTQPPSITVPPYPPDDSSSESNTALASYPSTKTGNSRTGSLTPSATDTTSPGTQPTGYAVGPYPTSSGSASTAQQTQQGFYQNSTTPETATADARNSSGSTFQPSYGAEQPNSTYAAPSGYGATTPPTSYGATTPYAAPSGYGATPAPTGDYAGVPSGAADTGYPMNPAGTAGGTYPAPAAGAYPAPAAGAYPTTDYAGTYPTTNAPYGTNSAAPYGTNSAPTAYGAMPSGPGQPVAPAGYGPEPAAVYSASSQNSAYGTAAGPAQGSASDTGYQYRPGSTGRNANLLSPSGGTRMATPAGTTTYPNTYYNR